MEKSASALQALKTLGQQNAPSTLENQIIDSIVFCGWLFSGLFLHADESASALLKMKSDQQEVITDGLFLAEKINSLQVNEQLVLLLDSTLKAWGEEGVFHPATSLHSLILLQERFPEYSDSEDKLKTTPENAQIFKKWWELNKDKIVYHEDGTHRFVEKPEAIKGSDVKPKPLNDYTTPSRNPQPDLKEPQQSLEEKEAIEPKAKTQTKQSGLL